MQKVLKRFVLKRFRRPMTVLGCLLLLSIVPMIVVAVWPMGVEQKALLKNYLSLPFFLFVSLFLALGTGNFLAVMLHGCREGRIQRLFYCLVGSLMALVALFMVYTYVITPLRDLPYVGAPATARLENVTFQWDQVGDTPSANLMGVGEDGQAQTFSIGYALYQDGIAFEEQVTASAPEDQLVANVCYLPYSHTLLQMDCWVEASHGD